QSGQGKWKEMAKDFADSTEFYRNIVVSIGELLGEEAYISDDGSVQSSVLTLKVKELVAKCIYERNSWKSFASTSNEIESYQRNAMIDMIFKFDNGSDDYPRQSPDYTAVPNHLAKLIDEMIAENERLREQP